MSRRETRPIAAFDDHMAGMSLERLDQTVLVGAVAFVVLCAAGTANTYGTGSLFLLIEAVHHYFSYFALAMAVLMLVISLYIGLRRHADVTPYFRRATYIVFGMIVWQAVLGIIMYVAYNVRPGEDVHLIYGAGTLVALPFFIFVERTAEKRPAMGSYMWGFALLAGILIRCISTGAIT